MNFKHGHCVGQNVSKTYGIWRAMIRRCYNPNVAYYDRYGGRGITVCERWHSFPNFLEDMGEKPEKLTLDRIDTNKEYSPENCRWATWVQQQNNRTNSLQVAYKGTTKTLKEFCRELGLNYSAVWERIKDGWEIERALSTPTKSPFKETAK